MSRAAPVALALAVSALSWLGASGCSSPLPVPVVGSHAGDEPVLVPYPPPPAKVEIVPDRPKEMKAPVWVDGEWLWKSRRWVWQSGQWSDVYPGATYAPPATVRLADGQLAWFAGAWHGGAATR